MKLTVDILGNGQQEKIFFIDSYLGMVKWSEKYHLQYVAPKVALLYFYSSAIFGATYCRNISERRLWAEIWFLKMRNSNFKKKFGLIYYI